MTILIPQLIQLVKLLQLNLAFLFVLEVHVLEIFLDACKCFVKVYEDLLFQEDFFVLEYLVVLDEHVVLGNLF